MAITLYTDAQRISPWVLTAWAALKEKGLSFTLQDVDLDRGDQRAPDYLARSLTGKIPALDHDGFWLTESIAIAEYLAETFPFPNHPRLFPADLRERARCRQVMLWLRIEPQLAPLRQARSTHALLYESERARLQPLSEAAAASAATLVRFAEALLPPGRDYLCGDWSIADVDLGFMLARLHECGDPLPERLAAYAARQWARPSVKAFVELARPALVGPPTR